MENKGVEKFQKLNLVPELWKELMLILKKLPREYKNEEKSKFTIDINYISFRELVLKYGIKSLSHLVDQIHKGFSKIYGNKTKITGWKQYNFESGIMYFNKDPDKVPLKQEHWDEMVKSPNSTYLKESRKLDNKAASNSAGHRYLLNKVISKKLFCIALNCGFQSQTQCLSHLIEKEYLSQLDAGKISQEALEEIKKIVEAMEKENFESNNNA